MDRNLEEIIKAMAKSIEKCPKDNNFRFRNEEDALHHASRFAQLKPGAFVSIRDSKGLHKGVFVQLDEKCRAKILRYDPQDGGHFISTMVPAAVIFDNMPAERTDAPQPAEAPACENCEDDEWDGAGLPDEFPRA